jgi:hypothetical protein
LTHKLTHQTRRKSQRSIDKIASEATQNPPIATTVIPTPTFTAPKSSQKRKRQTRRKSQKGIDRFVAIECPDFADTQTLPDFDINDTNLSEKLTDFMEVHISGFTLCKEFQETIFSL